jgi:hypothetical protein
MLRTAVHRALAFAAIFAVVWLVPLRARAAIVPVCDADAWSGHAAVIAPEIAPERAVVDCAVPGDPDEDGDPQIAAMCDARGASAVAPGRIHPMTDARIDAVVSCDGKHFGPQLGPPQGQEGQSTSPFTAVADVMLTVSVDLRPVWVDEVSSYPPVEGAPRRGVRREIDHPPRA